MSHDDFIEIITSRAKIESPRFAEQLKEFTARCGYVSGHEGGDKSFQALQARLEEFGEGKKEQHRLFYMALPPSAFVPVSEGLKKYCYSERGTSRLIVSVFYYCFQLLQAENPQLTVRRLKSRSVMILIVREPCRVL